MEGSLELIKAYSLLPEIAASAPGATHLKVTAPKSVPALWLRDYGLVEHVSADYPPRTSANVQLADATVIFGKRSKGSYLTEQICHTRSKPLIWIVRDTSGELMRFRLWLARYTPKTLNGAGNRESVTPGIGQQVRSFLMRAFDAVGRAHALG